MDSEKVKQKLHLHFACFQGADHVAELLANAATPTNRKQHSQCRVGVLECCCSSIAHHVIWHLWLHCPISEPCKATNDVSAKVWIEGLW